MLILNSTLVQARAPKSEIWLSQDFSFSVADPAKFVDEVERLLQLLPPNGLIIDVHGNGGGHIHAAELCLQLLTHDRIEPERAQFINSRLTLRLCELNSPNPEHPWFS
jgi:hypothetical protein